MRNYMKNEYMGKRNKSKESGNTSQKRLLKKKERERDLLILQMVIAAMKLKDAYSLEGKL